MKHTFLRATILLILLFSGCIVVPAIEGFNSLGLSKADREKLLPKVVKEFQDALYWSEPMAAGKYIKPENRDATIAELGKSVDGVRVVESKIMAIQYNDTSEKADVRVQMKSYKVPYYVVEDHYLMQKWEFSYSDGWLYDSQKEVKK